MSLYVYFPTKDEILDACADAAVGGAMTGMNGYDRWRTRVDNLPEVNGQTPVASLAREIETPGPGQLRALITVCGNPGTTGPAVNHIRAALAKLDVLICLDPYVTETSRHADAVLPPTLWLERESSPNFSQLHMAIPTAQWAPALVTPRGMARDDGWILDQISRRAGVIPNAMAIGRALDRIGIRPSPASNFDLLVRLGRHGDRFGLRRKGLSRKRLIADGTPVKLADRVPVGVLRKRIRHRDHRVHLDHPVMRQEMARMLGAPAQDPDLPLRLISVRELRSQNSWLHNVDKLTSGDRRQRVRIHPDDAAEAGVADGEEVEVVSARATIRLPVRVTDEIGPGVAAVNHAWGHEGGWRRAVAAGGAAVNSLLPDDPCQIDRASGQAFVNGVPVALRACR